MNKILKGFLILPLSLVFLCSCIIAVYDYSASTAVQPFEEFHRYFPFSPGGTLSLQNEGGNIEILGWGEHECEVYAERKVPLAEVPRLRLLRFNHYIPKIDIDTFDNFVKVQTMPAPAEDASNIVDYFIRVPEAVILKDIINRNGDILIADLYGEIFASTQVGDVTVDNFSGSLHVSVERGDVEVRLFDLREEDEIFISTYQGHITLYLQPDVSAKLEMSAPHGEIINEFEMDESSPTEKITVAYGTGDTFISVTTENGNISVKKIIE